MKILILVIYSNTQEYYNRMLAIQRKYVHNYKNVDVYFIQSSFLHNEKVFVENDMIHVRNKEEHKTILYKTLCSMECLKNFYKKEYDFTIRTNISTLINIPKMINLLSNYQDKEYLYAGDIAGVTSLNRHIRFALGTAIILSKKLANKMINEMHKFNHSLADDVAFGHFVEENIPQAFDNDLYFRKHVFYTNTLKNGYNSSLKNFILFPNKSNYIFYRNSLKNRYEDANIMNYICDNILKQYKL
jgi:hypothetical protein